jgi:hypothetical protein
MYKNASQNQQSRTERQAEFGHDNAHGVDPDAFATSAMTDRAERLFAVEQKRHLVVERKHNAENKLRQLTGQISRAVTAHRYGKPTAISASMFQALHLQKEQAADDLRAIELELSQLRFDKQQIAFDEEREKKKTAGNSKRDRKESFESVFVDMARTILATPVFDRVATATIHRLAELDENKSKTG